ncbi:MAG TPA: hypothetical protein PKA31_03355 [Candidatus Moranbacteria bacterium]|nr:hypothetical protein [Candidatus Moranbacteria bacterium]
MKNVTFRIFVLIVVTVTAAGCTGAGNYVRQDGRYDIIETRTPGLIETVLGSPFSVLATATQILTGTKQTVEVDRDDPYYKQGQANAAYLKELARREAVYRAGFASTLGITPRQPTPYYQRYR